MKVCKALFTGTRMPEEISDGELPEAYVNLKKEFQKAYRSSEGEVACELDEIEGALPDSLQGTLYRNGPGLFGTLLDSNVVDGRSLSAPSKSFRRSHYLCTQPVLKT